MKNASTNAERIKVIEYLKAALSPKALFSTMGDILVRLSDSKLTDADKRVAEIWADNKGSKENIDKLEERVRIPEKGAIGGKGKGNRIRKTKKYEVSVQPQESVRGTMESMDTHENSSKGFEIGE